jgi:CRP-like cAMP-binding protein
MLFFFIPTWDRRLRLLADWLIWPVVGRDVVDMNVADADDFELSYNVFQPGQIIVAEGRAGRYIHLVVEGEVELIRRSGGGEEVTSSLKAGDHFGQTWRDSTDPEWARARSIVRTVTLRTDQTRKLREIMSSVGQVVKA